ncbi:tetratricopeptide (TPR) repeat protein [Pontibacter aydingkolensis]|uniref:Aerotolerance protein n=1 Tax=Pontibacter aydingkolensis TaxID=1911536 RepID=A0ABS7CVN6_9BACT|nr:tetratricopeptide repeat protein [Pontibacter aydingkolensis]MBW7467562.1 aerotolerance protein [Pontibacter aydingkolensis]
MKSVLITVLLVSILGGGLRTISQVNEYAATAAKAYNNQQYQEAIVAYEYLLNDLEVKDDQIRLNLAHAYYNDNRLTQALEQYRLLADHQAMHLRSVVHLQLGNIATKQKKYKQALALYKQALIAEPENEAARYNYELLKKFLDLNPDMAELPEEQTPEPEQAQADSTTLPPPAQEEPQPGKKPDAKGEQEEETEQPQPDEKGQQQEGGSTSKPNEQTPQQQDKEQATGKSPGDTEGLNQDSQFDPKQQERSGSSENISEADIRAQTQRARLQKANISPERAKLLLDAMRNAEMQYIQQLPKKATKKPDRSKPDW